MEIPDGYQQLQEQEYKKETFSYYHCYVCKCSIPIEEGRRGCELHPECGCNVDIYFHKLI